MKIAGICLGLVFGLFAYWQLNDPDWWLWTSIYLIAAFMCLLAGFEKASSKLLLWIGAIALVFGFLLMPGAPLRWVEEERMASSLSMKTEFSEQWREASGLLIIAVSMGTLAWRRKASTSLKNATIAKS